MSPSTSFGVHWANFRKFCGWMAYMAEADFRFGSKAEMLTMSR